MLYTKSIQNIFSSLKLKFDFIWEEHKKTKSTTTQNTYFDQLAIDSNKLSNYYHSRNIININMLFNIYKKKNLIFFSPVSKIHHANVN